MIIFNTNIYYIADVYPTTVFYHLKYPHLYNNVKVLFEDYFIEYSIIASNPTFTTSSQFSKAFKSLFVIAFRQIKSSFIASVVNKMA